MKKVKVTTNRGKIFDWFLNRYLNFVIWSYGINDNIDLVASITADRIRKINKYL